MSSPADPTGTFNPHMHTALLEYAKAPGKYHVALRQPPLLFASIREILQIAADRAPELQAATEEEKTELRRAACFFVRTVLLSPGADHYTLLGLDRNFDGAELKNRYRLLMRLIHPDFSAAAAVSWPQDAAVRVNLAYEVLSSAVQRAEYETRLAAASKIATAPQVEHRRAPSPARGARAGMSRSRFKQLVVASSVVGAGGILLSLLMSGAESVHLVQRGQKAGATPPAAPAVAQAQAPVVHEAALPPTSPQPQPQPAPAAAATALASPIQAPSPSQRPAGKTDAASTSPREIVVARPSAPPSPALPEALVAVASPAPTASIAPPVLPTPAVVPVPVPVPAPSMAAAPVPAPAPVTEAAPRPGAAPVAVTVALPPPPAPRPVALATVSLADAQPLLANLLQQLESGRGERVINLLDREARNKPAAQALSQHYDSLVDGMRPVRLSHVEFKAQPADGRLLVIGHIQLQVGRQTIGSLGKKMVLRAEFASREGTVVMTGLSGAPGN